MIIIKLCQQESLESLKVLDGLIQLLKFGRKIDRRLQNNFDFNGNDACKSCMLLSSCFYIKFEQEQWKRKF
jgi:hypothetical protein